MQYKPSVELRKNVAIIEKKRKKIVVIHVETIYKVIHKSK
jgi:hypothetical protein